VRELLIKFARAYWRDPSYNFTRVLLSITFAIIFGVVYFKAGAAKETMRVADVANILGILFTATSLAGMTNLMAVMPVVGYERVVFYRWGSVLTGA
jgi:hypothetical protein